MSSQGPVITVGILMLSFMVWLWSISPHTSESDVEKWLNENKLSQLKDHPAIRPLEKLQDLAGLDLGSVTYVSSDKLKKLGAAVDKLKLVLWLREKGVEELSDALTERGVVSMKGLCKLSSGDELKDIEKHSSPSSVKKFRTLLEAFVENKCVSDELISATDTGWSLGSVLWLVFVVLALLAVSALVIGILVYSFLKVVMETLAEIIGKAIGAIVVVVIGGLITAILSAVTGRRVEPPQVNLGTSRTRRTTTNTSHFSLGLYDRIKGSYLHHPCCQVEWNSEDGVPVGGSTVVTVQLVCKNKSPYLFQTSDNLQCIITHTASGNVVPHVVEPTPLSNQSTIKISFTTRISGKYVVDLKINGRYIGASPFSRNFTPGPVDASKTVFIDQTAVVVVTKGLYSAIKVIPRDSFGNMAKISQQELTVEIRKNSADGPPINPECVVDQEQPNRYELLLKVEEEGYFVCCVKYGGQVIGPSSFSIISLSEHDSQVVEKNIGKKNLNVWYEAQLISSKGKAKTVYCYISPKQLQVREYFMKIIPTRAFTCKVCPSTRLKFHAESGKFTIDDSYQEPVTLVSSSRDILGATFYKFVLKNIGGSEKFQDKQSFFYTELKKHHHKHHRGDQRVAVSRFDLLNSARKVTKRFGTSDWCRKFVVEFEGEEGLDWGGLSREFFHILSVECFDVSNKMFTSFNKDNMQALVHPNPDRPSQLGLKYYEFAGKLVGKCLYESACGNPLMVKARFSRSFLAQIIGLRINYKYFSTDDPDLYTTKIQYIRENDVSDLGMVFTEEEFDKDGRNPKVVPLKENGEEIDVTEENKMEYLDLLAQYRLAKRVKDEIEAFLKGLNDIVPDHLLSIFDENELELLMCGVGRVSFDDLKRNAAISGSNSRFQIVLSWFWTIVSSFTQEEMAKLLQFVTGCSQLPPGGFTELSPRFQITFAPTRGRLPTAHTCFNQLCLPDYDSCEQFQTCLMMALNEGTEGFGLL